VQSRRLENLSMRRCGLLALVLLFGCWINQQEVSAQTAPTLSTGSSSRAANNSTVNSALNSDSGPKNAPGATESDDSLAWLFPVARVNESLPTWLRIGGQYRSRLEGPAGIGISGTKDFYLLDRLRVHLAIQPNDWLRFYGEVQDARIFFNHHIPNANPYEDSWTLWQGYAQLGNLKAGWVDVVAGRQVLMFGDERVIGPSNWLNVGRTFNVARIDFYPRDYQVSVFASSVVPGENTDLHNALPGNNLYGVYGSFQNIVPKANFEPYVLWRLAPRSPELPETLDRGHLNEVTIGLHWKGTLPAGFDYDTEFDGQTGSLGASSIAAWAGYAGIGKTLHQVAASPRVFIEGNYASGTKNPRGRDWNTFDQLYPSNHDKFGFADLVGRRNLEQFRTGVEEEPTKKWKLKQAFDGYWLATSNDNFYGSSGAIAVLAHPGANRHVGNELDLVAEYKLNEGLNFGFGYARMFAGKFLKTATAGHDYSYPYAYFEYNFSKSGFHFPITPNRRN
jgi:Alginate export